MFLFRSSGWISEIFWNLAREWEAETGVNPDSFEVLCLIDSIPERIGLR